MEYILEVTTGISTYNTKTSCIEGTSIHKSNNKENVRNSYDTVTKENLHVIKNIHMKHQEYNT